MPTQQQARQTVVKIVKTPSTYVSGQTGYDSKGNPNPITGYKTIRSSHGRVTTVTATPTTETKTTTETPLQKYQAQQALRFQTRESISRGEVSGVKMVGQTTVDTATGRLVGVRGGTIYNTKTGEVLNAPKTGHVEGTTTATLTKTPAVVYSGNMPNAPYTLREKFSPEGAKRFGRQLMSGGERDVQGNIVGTLNPVTAEDIATLVAPSKGFISGGWKVGTTMIAAPAITNVGSAFYEASYTPSTSAGRFTKGVIGGALIVSNPITSGAYAYQFMKSGVFNPKETAKSLYTSFKERPAESIGFIVGGSSGKYLKDKAIDTYRSYGKTEIKEASYTTKPFMKQEGGITRQVYYDRVPKVSATSPKSWLYKIQGYKPGEFLKRTYRTTSPEVRGFFEGKKSVTYYDVVKGNVVQVTAKTTRFPFANPSEQLNYFLKIQPSKYYLPGGAGKQYSLGYSATPNEWTGANKNVIGQNVPEYVSGKGVSQAFYRIGNKYGLGGNLFEYGQKPQLYAEYVPKTNVEVNPAKYESRIPNPFDIGGKPVKRYVFTNPEKSATFMLPVYKREVEANVFGLRQPINTKYYQVLQGRVVPIQQSIIVPGGEGLTPKGLQSLGSSSAPIASSSSILSSLGAIRYSPISSFSYTPTSYQAPSITYSISGTKSSGGSVSISTPKSYISTPPSSITSIPSSIISEPSIPSYPSRSYSSSSPKPFIGTPTYPRQYQTSSISSLIKKKKKKTIFEALSRRKGKEFSLGTYETQSQAESVLGKYLKSTLAASGRIKQEGRVLPFTSLKSFRSREFIPGKRDIFKVVQSRGFRLGTGSERIEIKKARRSKLKVW